MQMLLGAAGGLLAIVMMTVGALGIAGIISKLICVYLLKFEKNFSEIKNSDEFKEYERISNKIGNLKMQQSGFGSGIFNIFDKRYWLREKIVYMGGRDLLRD